MLLSPSDVPDGYSFSPEPSSGKYTVLSCPVVQEREHPDIKVLRLDLETIIHPYVKPHGIFDAIIEKHLESMRKKVSAAFEMRFKKK